MNIKMKIFRHLRSKIKRICKNELKSKVTLKTVGLLPEKEG